MNDIIFLLTKKKSRRFIGTHDIIIIKDARRFMGMNARMFTKK